MVGVNSGYIASLPAPVKKRLKALKKIQLESTKIEAKFYEEVHKLECKYHEMYKPLYEQRGRITKGEYEPMTMNVSGQVMTKKKTKNLLVI